jgi:hypothetical protein
MSTTQSAAEQTLARIKRELANVRPIDLSGRERTVLKHIEQHEIWTGKPLEKPKEWV